MIARLEGRLAEQSPTRLVIDVAGVGYEVHVPLSTFTELADLGSSVALHIHTHANEGAVTLFGFHSLPEKVAFELLIRVNRVGPRLAQSILSGISPKELLEAIRAENLAALRAVPGVGSKVAERIQLELRDRIEELSPVLGDPDIAAPSDAPGDSAREQTLSALVNLGYSRAEADRVLDDAAADAGHDATLETLVRASLKRLGR